MTRKIALVTGGSRGIGRDVALSLARSGFGCVLTYLNGKDQADAVIGEIEALGGSAAALPLNLADTSGLPDFRQRLVATLADRFGTDRLDALINNAGFGKTIPIQDLTEVEFDTFVDVHFKGVVFLTRTVLEIMRDDGSVVFITAGADRFNVPGYAAYGACKGAVEVFARYVAVEYGPRRIRSNTVAPGGIVTDFNGGAIRGSPRAQEMIIGRTPMGRLGEPRDISDVVALLCDDGARWLTGQRLEVTGGFNL